MASTRAVRGILAFDGLRLARDRFVVSVSLYIIAMTIALRWILPWLTRELDARLGFDFTPYVPLLASHFLIQLSGQVGGIILGFLLLESREDRTIRAMLVTPIPMQRYLAILGLVVMAATVPLALLEGVIIQWGLPPWPGFTLAAIVGAPGAFIFGLLVATLASDKTQAFAYMKILGLLPAAASAAWFVDEPWQWLFAVYPPYCASKIYWLSEAGQPGGLPYAVLGLVGSLVWIAVLARLFLRVARR
ncbi:MAG: hypothetical protein AAGE01_20730 [Pseudomonadota bacterium]